MKKSSKNSSLTIESKQPWHTEFQGEITDIKVNGQKISDVHDLTSKVISMTKTIRVLAYTATVLAIMAVGTVFFIAQWLVSHEASIEQLLLTGNEDYNQMRVDSLAWNAHKRERAYVHLKEFHGLHWDVKVQDWVKPPPPPPPLKPNPIGGANYLDLKWAGR
jgi:hypothetical protein